MEFSQENAATSSPAMITKGREPGRQYIRQKLFSCSDGAVIENARQQALGSHFVENMPE